MAHVDINVRILANRFKIQPSGVFRHFGYFHLYRPMAHWKAVLRSIFLCNILAARPRTLLPHRTARCFSGCVIAAFVLKTPRFLDFVDLLWLAMAHLLLSLMAMWSLTSATVNDCIETACRGCSGEQCQLCREDTNTVSACVANCTLTFRVFWRSFGCFPPALLKHAMCGHFLLHRCDRCLENACV